MLSLGGSYCFRQAVASTEDIAVSTTVIIVHFGGETKHEAFNISEVIECSGT